MRKCTLTDDKINPSAYRVESVTEDGRVEVAVFSGPNAFNRAHHFAFSDGPCYYEECEDQSAVSKLTDW
jgi:hypothetical protein